LKIANITQMSATVSGLPAQIRAVIAGSVREGLHQLSDTMTTAQRAMEAQIIDRLSKAPIFSDNFESSTQTVREAIFSHPHEGLGQVFFNAFGSMSMSDFLDLGISKITGAISRFGRDGFNKLSSALAAYYNRARLPIQSLIETNLYQTAIKKELWFPEAHGKLVERFSN
jgi:hypothetical protein